MQQANLDFTSLDLGSSQPISVPLETIEVEISSTEMVAEYAKAFVREAYRVNPLRAEQVHLTEEEMINYAQFLLAKRVETVEQTIRDWNRLKSLYIPVFLQYAMRVVGEVIVRDRGIRLVPVFKEEVVFNLNQAIEVSNKVGAFEDDLQVVRDAMPRGIDGDESIMGTALIAGYVRSIRKVDHVSDTYVSAFLGFKLRQEQAFAVLYRIQYDDIEFITSALTRAKIF
jgi:hypothetical protein